jgi:glycosyltransferase involved in cell wall biosynthesis
MTLSPPQAAPALAQVTPLILTYNEEANIARTLAGLGWAQRIVVIDSGSSDRTLALLAEHPAVTVHQRPFDSHARQWNFGLEQVSSPWVLSLDADYRIPPALVAEIEAALGGAQAGAVAGYWLRFRYCVAGRPLRGSILPPRLALFRRAAGRYVDDGHTQRLVLRGASGQLRTPILHDDRKPLSRWLWAQQRYVALEADKLLAAGPGPRRLSDRVRRLGVVAPPAVFLLCLLRGGLLDGWRGWFYALQRLYVETLLALTLLERRLNGPPSAGR